MYSISEVFVKGDVELLLRNQPVTDKEDFYSWKYNKSGQMTVKSAYWLASSKKIEKNFPEVIDGPSINPLKEQVWKVLTASKIKVFLWKSISNALPTADLITSKGMKVDKRCQTCGEEPETINHMLFACTFAREVWTSSTIPNPRGGGGSLPTLSLLTLTPYWS